MKISYFPKQMALQSEPIWQSFLEGCKANNLNPIEESMDADMAVIWSVLWYGRLRYNQQIYQHYRQQNKPVFIIEVGSLSRGNLWKISINHITTNGIYPYPNILDLERPTKLGLTLQTNNNKRDDAILIATQHRYSLQWENLPDPDQWVNDLIKTIRLYSSRDIIVRPHPRSPINVSMPGVHMQIPHKIENTYDRYDINYNYHCVINYSSGPSIQSAIAGTPIVTSSDSLAYPVSFPIEQINDPYLLDRQKWFIKLSHTEWTVDEIKQGIPQRYLLDLIDI